MGEPTIEERARESSLLYTTLADVMTTALLVIFAVVTGSLTLLGEAIRSILMLVIEFYALWVLLAVHRDRLTRFQYGVGKLEQFVGIVVALGLLLSGLWIAQTVIGTILADRPVASPFGLAMAAVINGINTTINLLGWYAMRKASRPDDSDVFRAQLRTRFIMMVSSMFLQCTLTAAALARDASIALVLDVTGATFVAVLMLSNGVSMIARSLPDLLDAPATDDIAALIRKSAAAVLPGEDIAGIRTRRSGRVTFAEVAIASTTSLSVDALRDSTASITNDLLREGAEVDLAVIVAPADDPAGVG